MFSAAFFRSAISHLETRINRRGGADLDQALAENTGNYEIFTANGDADGDGNFFNDGDEESVPISSISYDPSVDRVTITPGEQIFDDVYRVNLDGDDASSDSTPGITDTDGDFLFGGDFSTDLDVRAFTFVEDLIAKVEDLGLDTGSENSLVGKLAGASEQLDQDITNDMGVVAILEAFIDGVNDWFDRGEITSDQRDELIADAELIITGLTGSALYVGSGELGTATGVSLGQANVQSAIGEALAWWDSEASGPAPAGWPGQLDVHVADLWGGMLGMASPSGTIWIDRDAAGYGWANRSNPNGVDLHSVLIHEMGQVLGFGHSENHHDVMAPTLAPSQQHAHAGAIDFGAISRLDTNPFSRGNPAIARQQREPEVAEVLRDHPDLWMPAEAESVAVIAEASRRNRIAAERTDDDEEHERDRLFAQLEEESVEGQPLSLTAQ